MSSFPPAAADGSAGAAADSHLPPTAADAAPRQHQHLTSRAQLVSSGAALCVDQRYAEAAAVFRGLANRLDPGDTEAVDLDEGGPAAAFLVDVMAATSSGGGSKTNKRKNTPHILGRRDALELFRDARFRAARAILQEEPSSHRNTGGDDDASGGGCGSPGAHSGESPMSAGRLSGSKLGATRSSGRMRRTSDLRQHPEEDQGDMMVDPAQLESMVERENQAWLDLADAWPPTSSSSSSSAAVVVIRGEPVPRLQAAQTALTWWQRSRAKLAIACRAKANALPVNSAEARELYVRSLSFDASSDTNATAWNNLAASLGEGDGDYVRIGDGSYTRVECFLTALENPDLQARAAVWANAIKCFGADESRNVPRFGHVSRSELADLLVAGGGSPSRHGGKQHQQQQQQPAAQTSMGAGGGGPIFSDPTDIAMIKRAVTSSAGNGGSGKRGFLSSVFGRKKKS